MTIITLRYIDADENIMDIDDEDVADCPKCLQRVKVDDEAAIVKIDGALSVAHLHCAVTAVTDMCLNCGHSFDCEMNHDTCPECGFVILRQWGISFPAKREGGQDL